MRVVADVEAAVRVDSVGRATADPEVPRERRAAVPRVRGPDLVVVVRNAVGVSAPADPEVAPGVVPGESDTPALLVEGDRRVVLAVGRVVVVQLDRR